jgi:hypothetical protein
MFQLLPMATTADVLSARTGAEVVTEGMTLRVNRRSWSRGAEEAAIIAGTLPADEVVLTSDGRHYDHHGWHEGPEADAIYVERWTRQGREFHGWVDSVSRRLVQAG